MRFELTDEQAFVLLNLWTETIENDRYPLSPRIQTLREVVARFRPIALPSPPAYISKTTRRLHFQDHMERIR